MKISSDLSVRAIHHGIVINNDLSMTRLVRLIQKGEEKASCFRTDEQYFCLKTSETCEWANDCKNGLVAHWKR